MTIAAAVVAAAVVAAAVALAAVAEVVVAVAGACNGSGYSDRCFAVLVVKCT